MRYLELRQNIKLNIFSLADVLKYFPQENEQSTKIQLSRFVKKNLLFSLKRGWYCFEPDRVDELELGNILYKPSYISLETALNYYGLIPDIPQGVTSITTTTTKKIINNFGVFYYTKIDKSLFFGFTKIELPEKGKFINIAFKEKALLDYFYIRKIANTYDLRLNKTLLDKELYQNLAQVFPAWVRKIKLS